MFLSWKLWRTLHYPPASQIFHWRVVTARSPGLRRFLHVQMDSRWWRILIALGLAYAVFRWGITSLLMIFFVLPGALILAFILFPVLLPFITLIIGAYWSASVSLSVLRERSARTYDLLCMGPNGTLGANWAIAGNTLHQNGLFTSLYYGTIASVLLGGVGVLLMVGVFVLLILSGASIAELVPAARTLFDLIVLLSAFWLHYVHSVVLSTMVGIFVPTYMGHDAPWVSFGFFLAIQVGLYGLFALLLHLTWPLTNTLLLDLWWAYLLVPFFYLLVLALIREGLLMWMWGIVSARLNADSSERNLLLRFLGS